MVMSRFALTLQPVNDRHGRPVELRLRLVLKKLLRECAFRCVEVRETDKREKVRSVAA